MIEVAYRTDAEVGRRMIGLGCRDRADLQAADVFLNQLVADIEALRDTLRDVACGNLSAGRAGNLRKDKTGIDRVNAHRYRLSHVLGAAVAERPHSKAEAFVETRIEIGPL